MVLSMTLFSCHFLGVFVITEAKSFVTYLNYNQQPRLFFQATEGRERLPRPNGKQIHRGSRERERAAASYALSCPPFHLLRLFYVSNGCSGEFISIFSFFFSFHLFLLLLPIYLFLSGFATIQFITPETLYDNSVYSII